MWEEYYLDPTSNYIKVLMQYMKSCPEWSILPRNVICNVMCNDDQNIHHRCVQKKLSLGGPTLKKWRKMFEDRIKNLQQLVKIVFFSADTFFGCHGIWDFWKFIAIKLKTQEENRERDSREREREMLWVYNSVWLDTSGKDHFSLQHNSKQYRVIYITMNFVQI